MSTADILSLNDHRPPVSYRIDITQWWDGRMSVWVRDIADDPENRTRLAVALRQAADMVETPTGNDNAEC